MSKEKIKLNSEKINKRESRIKLVQIEDNNENDKNKRLKTRIVDD